MGFFDKPISNNKPEEVDGNADNLGQTIADKLRDNPTEAVDVHAMAQALAKKKKAMNKERGDDIFSEYLDGISGGRRIATLKNILNRK